jgi:glycine oxidase
MVGESDDRAPDIAVVGGGVIGCACAWMLARAGASVALYERGAIAAEASGASAGVLGPLAESVQPGPAADLAVAGLLAFADEIDALIEESGIDPEYHRCGVIRMALDARDVTGLQACLPWQAARGLGLRWLEAGEVAALEPALAPSLGALVSTEEAQVRPALLTLALANAAARRGARLFEHVAVAGAALIDGKVSGVRLTDGTVRPAGSVLIAGGPWSGAAAGEWANVVPVMPVKGQYALLSAIPRSLRHVVFVGHGYLVPRRDGTIYAGATMENAGFDRRVTLDGLREVLETARAILPALRDAEVIGTGAGLRPSSADGLPILGALPGAENLYVATGHFRNGVLMSLITARLMTELILHGEPSMSLAPFSPRRFVKE